MTETVLQTVFFSSFERTGKYDILNGFERGADRHGKERRTCRKYCDRDNQMDCPDLYDDRSLGENAVSRCSGNADAGKNCLPTVLLGTGGGL